MVARALLAGLVDDAALFPPGNAPMDRAVREHAGHRSGWYAGVVGPFLCPASRIDELIDTLPADQDLRISLVFDVTGEDAHAALRSAVADPRITLAGVEAPMARLGADAIAVGANLARLTGVTGCLEVPRTAYDAALELVGSPGWHLAKYRTGGLSADAFPTEQELAGFVVAATTRAVPFKLTAGLHHAARTTDPATGFEQHGVLNVLVATRVAQQGSGTADVAAVLAEKATGPLVEFVQDWTEDTCIDVRRAFRSFGCCGVTDPIDELRALGVLEGEQ